MIKRLSTSAQIERGRSPDSRTPLFRQYYSVTPITILRYYHHVTRVVYKSIVSSSSANRFGIANPFQLPTHLNSLRPPSPGTRRVQAETAFPLWAKCGTNETGLRLIQFWIFGFSFFLLRVVRELLQVLPPLTLDGTNERPRGPLLHVVSTLH